MRSASAALVAGSAMLAVMLAVSALAPWIVPYRATDQHMLDRLKPPGVTFLLGTDQYGRDLLSRTLLGAHTALVLGLGAVALGLVLGVPIGMVAGYVGGWVDDVVMRLVDALLAFPSLLLALLIITALGASTTHALLAIGVANAPGVARIVRSATLALREQEFVLAARARGERHAYVVFGEIFPNVLAPVVVEATIRIGFAILAGASLSFLGLGVQPPAPNWGVMISENQVGIPQGYPLPALAAGGCIVAVVIAFNVLGERLFEQAQARR
jgi:peptide/nickel transport system permease protein